ncbi:unnamed protein product [Musa hybrid cultivar]
MCSRKGWFSWISHIPLKNTLFSSAPADSEAKRQEMVAAYMSKKCAHKASLSISAKEQRNERTGKLTQAPQSCGFSSVAKLRKKSKLHQRIFSMKLRGQFI